MVCGDAAEGNEKTLKSAAIIYARTSSTRFPRKCFTPLGKDRIPLSHWVVRRAVFLNVDEIFFATTEESADDDLVNSIESLGISNLKLIRGSETDLIERTLDCLRCTEAEYFVRINGDSPFFPLVEINEALQQIKHNPALMFVSNLKQRSYPYGVAVEVINVDFYIKYASMAIQQDLEHTTSHLYRVAFDEITPIIDSINFDAISLTVDTKEDFERVNGLIIERDLSLSSSWRLAL